MVVRKGSVEKVVAPDFWKGKKVFLTGHTGFKGSWMSLWLLKAGAQLTGYSLGLPTNPSLFKELEIEKDMKSIFANVCDGERLKTELKLANPEIVIHMAAQPLVRYSYQAPVETYLTNVIGTVHLFEAVRAASNVRAILNITSDKCYENRERQDGYKEFEAMGGFDPYSSSKGCSELVTSAYRRSFFQKERIGLASGRAGNVIGGGDWALDRLVPDIIRATLSKETLKIRNPGATRPWQHVLEPVGGYLLLAQKLFSDQEKFAEGFNFGPSDQDHWSVEQILSKMNQLWNNRVQYQIEKELNQPHEAHLLSLSCVKAEEQLNWKPKWHVDQALQKTIEWVDARELRENMREVSLKQICEYESV